MKGRFVDAKTGEDITDGPGREAFMKREGLIPGAEKSESKESKEAKFKRVAEPRVAQVVHYLGLLEHCAGLGYTSSKKREAQMFDTIDAAVQRLRDAFNADQGAFTFKD